MNRFGVAAGDAPLSPDGAAGTTGGEAGTTAGGSVAARRQLHTVFDLKGFVASMSLYFLSLHKIYNIRITYIDIHTLYV